MRGELEELHRASNRLHDADSLEDCYQITIDAAVNILGLDWCSLVAPADDAELFEIKAISEEGTVEVGHRPFSLDEGIAGEVYETKETHYVAHVSSSERAAPTDDSIRSALTVPVGDWGVFHAMSTEPDSFDERDRNWAELLCMSLGTAIERHEQDERLRSQNERLEQFASIVSHDLRNPLNVAKMRLELAQEECSSSHLADIDDALDRMERLVDNLLVLAREGELVDDGEWIELTAIVEECWHNVVTADATLQTDGEPTLRADRVRLGQLLENLFRNAVEHGSPGPDSQARQDAVEHGSPDAPEEASLEGSGCGDPGVTVTVGGLDDGFYVEDDGIGVAPGERERIFETGYSTASDGTGFGLAIVEEVAAGHGWQVDVVEGTDGGARFEFTGVRLA